jgi:tRNA-specific 2-thiouridylase
VGEVNWIHQPSRFPTEASVQIRYRHRAAAARLLLSDEDRRVRVQFHETQNAITPGQGAVFYDGAEVLGSGWIV